MTGRAGERKGNELWLRCPHCGDSQKDPTKAHYSVNTEGLFHCLRCGAGGKLQLKDFLALSLHDSIDMVEDSVEEYAWQDTLEELMPGAAYTRYSALDRFHLTTPDALYDAFLSRNLAGDVVGVALSDLQAHRRLILGEKLLGWVGEDLLSTPADPLRLVEGPYDVLSERDVCCYGIPRPSQLKLLRGHCVILCPDGDVWTDVTKRNALLRTLLNHRQGAQVMGIERLPDNKDPDEVPYSERKLISTKEIRRQWNRRKRRHWTA